MADFQAVVTAVLNTNGLKSALENQEFTVSNIKVNSSGLVSQIQSALSSADFKIDVKINGGTGKGGKGGIAGSLTSEYKELYSLARKMGNLDLRISGLDSTANAGQIKEIERQLTSLSEKFKTTFSKAEGKLTGTQKSNLQAVFGDALDRLKELEARLQDSKNNLAKKIDFKVDTGDIKSKFEAIKKQFNAVENKSDDVKKNFAELEKSYKTLSDPNASMSDKIAAFDKFNSLIGTTSKQMQDVAKAELTLSKSKALSSKITKWMNDNPKAAEAYKQELTEIQNKLQSCSDPAVFSKLSQQYRQITADAKAFGLTNNNLVTGFGKMALQVAGLGTAFQVFNKTIQLIGKGVNTVRELDDSLVDLKKTTTMSASDLNDFYYSANKSAKKLGVTTKEIIQSAADWSRLGFSDKQSATRMAELSSQFAAISPGLNIEDATSGLLSVMRAFDIEVDDVLDGVMSKINTVGNKFGTSNTEIIAGLTKSAAAFSMMGGSLEENIALFTAAQEIIQNPEQVGNALRSITMRIRGYDEETEQLSDDLVNINGDLIDLTKTAENPDGISLFKDSAQTEYKQIGEYLSEIAEIYDDLDASTQQNLMEKLFGKNRATVGAAILKNIDQYKAALEAMEGSAGSADAEMSIITESISYHMNQLGETWTGIAQNVFQSDLIKGVVDQLTSISEVIQNITDVSAGGALAGLAGIAIGIKGIS